MNSYFGTISFLFFFFLSVAALAADPSVFRIAKVTDRTAIIRVPKDYKRGQNVLFVRGSTNPDDDDYEVIANGKILTSKNGLAVIQMDLETLKKRPERSDHAVLLGAPRVFPDKVEPGQNNHIVADPPPNEKFEPGYISLRYLSLGNKLDSTGSTEANRFKVIGNLPKSGFELEWFVDFLSHFGFGFSSTSGRVPIRNYYSREVDAEVSQMALRLFYRTYKNSNFRAHFFLQGLTEDFATANTDETVLGTKLESTLLGTTLFYEPGDLLLQRSRTAFQFTYLKIGYLMSISGKATDLVVSRGTSGNATIGELTYGIGATMWLPWMPYVKRYTLSVDGFQRKLDLQFSGPTKPEDVLPVRPIAANGTYSETESGVIFSIGIRMDDFIGALFKPKE